MKKLGLSDWANLGELVASVAVVASLYFLIVGINQNTAQIRSNANQAIFRQVSEIEMAIASDPTWSRIVVAGMQPGAQLTEVEQYRYDAYLEANLDVWDAMEALWAQGQIRASTWSGWNTYFENWAQLHVSLESWERLKWQYPPEGSLVYTMVEGAIQKE